VHTVKILDSHELALEVVVEELIIRAKSEYFLLFELSEHQVLHLLVREFALFVHLLDLLERADLVQVVLLLDHVDASLENTINLMRLSQLDTSWLVVFLVVRIWLFNT